MPEFDPSLARYNRQMLFEPLGQAGQKRLALSQATLIGCGALGTVLANTLARAGVGHLRIIDRDFIELDNLQRQVLFDEHDIAANLPKAEAAARKLRKINSTIEIEAVVADVNPANAEPLCRDCDLLLDGTDNFETRFLINDLAVKFDLPWVYGACVAAEGLVMPIIPGITPCLRCIWDESPPPGMSPTCDTAGVLGPLVEIVAGFQALEAIKILAGKLDALNRKLMTIDAWSGRVRSVDMSAAREQGDCACCKQRKFEYLSGEKTPATAILCGRDAVQIAAPAGGNRIDLRELAGRLRNLRPQHNEFLLRFSVDPLTLTLFSDGRAIVKGTRDPAVARGLYAKYIGA